MKGKKPREGEGGVGLRALSVWRPVDVPTLSSTCVACATGSEKNTKIKVEGKK